MAKARRYAELMKLVEETKPATILEIGVWNGQRAMEMATVALKYSPKVHYAGYDLFDDATPETDEVEFNKKRTLTVAETRKRLNDFANMNPGFSFELHRGNTRQTLTEQSVDFAYIDGGHSVETIRSDYEAVRFSQTVVFDDYYRPNDAGQCPDIVKFGANVIVDGIEGAKIIDTHDPVAGGGYVCLAVVRGRRPRSDMVA